MLNRSIMDWNIPFPGKITVARDWICPHLSGQRAGQPVRFVANPSSPHEAAAAFFSLHHFSRGGSRTNPQAQGRAQATFASGKRQSNEVAAWLSSGVDCRRTVSPPAIGHVLG